MYMLSENMFKQCMNKVHTSNVQINLCMYKSKKSDELGIERHHIAGPSLDIDLLKAEIGGEAGLGTADVADHC